MSSRLISRYTNTVLAFDITDGEKATTCAQPSDEDIAHFTERTLKMFDKSNATYLVLFGLGSGAQALALDKALPGKAKLIVCETNLTTARTFLEHNPAWREDDTRSSIISDSSPWAQLYLLATIGATPKNTSLALNPDIPEDNRKRYQALQRLFMNAKPHQAINSTYLSHLAVQAPNLSVGVILDPNEPDLDTFFAQFPDWIKEIVVIWDADTVPDTNCSCAVPIRQFAQPLEDFSTQRNRMLDECSGDWVLYLDGDELFSDDIWNLFTAIMPIKRLEACYFPRMTFYPDEAHCKVGYGMWPDLQLRLFRKKDGVRFERPIHERLTGINGRIALALDSPILHYSRLRKSPAELTAKLKRFDEAGGNSVHHMLNDDYPNLERTLFSEASLISGSLEVLLLEENPS
ncbi:MAG: glycosyl transferase family 2 [Pseudodesulfovibrio sp.]|nr:glycosyl transferase family 2 [Pseudodesulfovibrio sp.]